MSTQILSNNNKEVLNDCNDELHESLPSTKASIAISPCFDCEAMDLSLIKFRLMKKDGWAEVKADSVIAEYRRFLFLTVSTLEELGPSSAVD